jgi:ABC-type multidrug transport system fused ATPase/permease subunit
MEGNRMDGKEGSAPLHAGREAFTLFKPHWRRLALSAVFAALAALAPIFVALITQNLVNEFASAAAVGQLAGWWALCLVVEMGCQVATTALTYKVGWTVAHRLADRVFERLLHQSLSYHEAHGLGEAQTLLARSVNEVGNAASTGLSVVVGWVTLAVGGLLGLAVLDVRWLAAAVPVVAIAWVGGSRLSTHERRAARPLIANEDRQSAIIGQVFEEARFRVIWHASLQEAFLEKFKALTAEHQRLVDARSAVYALYTQLMPTLPGLVLPVAWLLGRVLGVGLAEVVAAAGLLSQVLTGGARGAMWYVQLVRAWPYAARALAVPSGAADQAPVDGRIQPDDLDGQPLTLTSVTCTRGGHRALAGIDLRIPARGYFVLVGPNGAGKSTLLDVLTGLVPADGEPAAIRIGQIPIGSIPRPVRAAHIQKIDSSPVWFDGTALENITLGYPDARDEEIEWACRFAAVDFPLIKSRLSTGQQVQALIARAMLARPKVLVLDEALKHLAPRLRLQVRARLAVAVPLVLESIHEGAVRSAAVTEILVISNGQVVERGTHADLMARGGYYATTVAASRN